MIKKSRQATNGISRAFFRGETVHAACNAQCVRELFQRFRFRGQSPVRGHRVENFRVALRPGIVDRDAFEAPFLAVTHELAIVAVH
jgi:hypothetical protein